MNTTHRYIMWCVFLAGMALRIGLTLVNREANDDHFRVVKIIQTEYRLPDECDCTQAYHPKLFHLTGAMVLSILCLQDENDQKVALQLMNCLAGGITIWLLMLFLLDTGLPPFAAVTGFALAVLNPDLIAITAQVTNDAFAILFTTVGLFFLHRFLRTGKWRDFIIVVAGVVLAALTKASGVILFGIVGCLLCTKALAEWQCRPLRARAIWRIGLYVVAFLAFVPLPGQYVQKIQRYGKVFSPTKTAPRPHLFKERFLWDEDNRRPGLTSIANTFCTFRLVDLMEHPVVRNTYRREDQVFPRHRTSFWTQLYGRANSIRFAAWPPSWQTNTDKYVLNLERCAFLFALAPCIVLVAGIVRGCWLTSRAAIKVAVPELNGWDVARTLTIVCYVGGVAWYTYRYWDYSCMKVIFMLPAVLCFAQAFADGLAWISRNGERTVVARWVVILSVSLLACYTLDVVRLIVDLGGGA